MRDKNRILKRLSFVVFSLVAVLYWSASRPTTSPILTKDDETAGGQIEGKGIREGDLIPNLAFSKFDIIGGSNSENKALRDFLGHPLVVHFWATWCLPCIEELPELLDFAEIVSRSGIRVVAISVDDNELALQKTLKKFFSGNRRIHQTGIFSDPGGIKARFFGTDKYPETYIFSREGKFIKKFEGGAHWKSREVLEWFENLSK